MSRATSPNSRTRQWPRLPAVGRLVTHLILAVGALAMIGPFVWSTLTSFKTLGEAIQVPPTILPEQLRWENYAQVFTQLPFLAFYENTIIVTAVKVVGVLITSSLAGYAFARIEFPGRNVLFALYLAVLMVPYQIFLLPQFLIMAKLGWVNDFLWPLVVINSPERMTLGAGLAFLQGQYLTDFPLLMAGAMLSTLPVIAVFVVLQRQFVEGVASTGIKG